MEFSTQYTESLFSVAFIDLVSKAFVIYMVTFYLYCEYLVVQSYNS